MIPRSKEAGRDELIAARRQSRPYYWFVAIFSFFVNLLMLTGPLYMLQVYDRVLGSRSIATLIALSGLVVFLYGMMGILDYARGRVMARVAARFQAAMDVRVFDAVMRRAAVTSVRSAPCPGMRRPSIDAANAVPSGSTARRTARRSDIA